MSRTIQVQITGLETPLAIRRAYLWLMHKLGRHVLSDDCWCLPGIEWVHSEAVIMARDDEYVIGFSPDQRILYHHRGRPTS